MIINNLDKYPGRPGLKCRFQFHLNVHIPNTVFIITVIDKRCPNQMHFSNPFATVLVLLGSTTGIAGHADDLVVADPRSSHPRAAAIEPRSVDEQRLAGEK